MTISTRSLVFSVITLTLLMDALSKVWIEHAPGSSVSMALMGAYMRVALHKNTGLASGVLSQNAVVPLVVPAFSFLLVSIFLVFILASGLSSAGMPAGLIVGGGLGNLGNRLIHGHTDDFLYVELGRSHAVVFNLADVFVAVGIVFLVLILMHQWWLVTWGDSAR